MRNMTFSDYPATLTELDVSGISEVSGGGIWSGTFEVVIDTTAIREVYDFLRDLFNRCCSCDG